ncbi:MAG: hypothetical protein EOP00_21670, partial [Pedobacter sp.]
MISTVDSRNQIREIDQIAIRYKEQSDIDELRAIGIRVEVYFDTYHVLPMIQGYWELQKDIFGNIDMQIFKDDRFLVKSLAYYGFIKNIKVLLPHAVELNNQLDKDFLLPKYEVDTKNIDEFLSAIGLYDLEQLKEVHKKEKLEEYLLQLSPHAENIFKANYVLSERVWTERYNYLFKPSMPIIQYDEAKYDTVQILESKLFRDIINVLGKKEERKHKSINNLRDAIALCMFQTRLKQSEKSNTLPIFYVSSSVLASLPDEIKDVFQIKFHKKTINVLKDSEFFIMDCMFSEDSSKQDDILFSKLKHLKQALKFYSKGQTFLDEEINSIVSNWKKFRNNDFFEKIWNDEKGSKITLSKNIRKLIDFDRLLKDENSFKKLIEQQRGRIKDDITTMVTDLVFLENVWKVIDSFDEFLNESINKENHELHLEESDIFRDEGLTRFSPPNGEIEKHIKDLWEQFLDCYQKNEKKNYHSHKVQITKMLYDGLSKHDHKNYESILVGISILWVFRKEQLIVQIVDKLDFNYGKYYQIGLIMLASMIKLWHKSSGQQRKMEKIIYIIESSESYNNNYKAWIGISYIKFNIWRINRDNHTIENEQKFRSYRDEGVSLAHKSFSYLEKIKDIDDQSSLYRNVKY